ncbi:MAG: amino acid adenylation domain-containing protein, partial [Chloroflexota bacterium]
MENIETLLEELIQLGINVDIDGEELAIDAPITALTPEILTQLTSHKADIIAHLSLRPRTIPMTESQKELWAVVKLNPLDSAVYNVATAVKLSGPFNFEAFKTAVSQLIERHEALRAIPHANGISLNVHAQCPIEIPLLDLSNESEAEQQAKITAFKRNEVTKFFDLTRGPLFRVKLLKLAPESHLVFLTVHHIIADGWSLTVMGKNLGELYTAVLQNRAPKLPPTKQLSHYVAHQHEEAKSESYRRSEQYWLREFGNNIPVLDLPTDFKRPAKKTYSACHINRPIAPTLIAQIKEAARQNKTSFYTFMLSAFNTLLHRLSGQDSVVVGIPVAGQMQEPNVDLVAFCVNFLPIRHDFEAEQSFQDVLRNTHQKLIQGFAHQNYNSGTLMKLLPIKRDPSRLPLISVAFNQFPKPPTLNFDALSSEINLMPRETEVYELFINIAELPQGYFVQCTANSDLFAEETIERFVESYLTLVETAVSQPATPIHTLPILSQLDYQKVVYEWNQTEMPYDQSLTLTDLFEAQVARTPEKTAVKFENQSLTYSELKAQADRLAKQLRHLGVQPNQFVGIFHERSIEMLVALLAVHKAGAAYLPMDPTYPHERLAFMLEDTHAKIIISQHSLLSELPEFNGQVLLTDELNSHQLMVNGQWSIENTQSPNPQLPITDYQLSTPNSRSPILRQAQDKFSNPQLAYIIYTSGSTGKPKGVMVTQQNVLNFLLTMKERPGLSAADRLLAITTLSFDIAVLELFLPLITGATVVIAGTAVTFNAEQLTAVLQQEQITIMQATPATWQMLIRAGWQPHSRFKMLAGGEPIPQTLAANLLKSGNELWNMYGPTETTVWSSIHELKPNQPILIGKPIGNTWLYILDSSQNPLPVGAIGELWIGGDGITSGYLNRDELTDERFIDNPFHPGKMYRTGDLARYHTDGNVECLGRVDFQVKIRGYRIECGEIEAALEKHPAIAQAVVHPFDFGSEDKRLVGFYTLNDGHIELEHHDMRSRLLTSLPSYMVPSKFIHLDKMPLTPNGKVNRKGLPDPVQNSKERRYVPPKSAVEIKLAQYWQDALFVERVGIEDDFFELGGHSLLATQL